MTGQHRIGQLAGAVGRLRPGRGEPGGRAERASGHRRGSKLVLAASTLALVGLVATAAPATAAPAKSYAGLPALHGTTSVTTAPGIVAALVGKGVLPLPVLPKTSFKLGTAKGAVVATYGFPIYAGNPDLSGPSGDILHLGGIYFAGLGGKSLSIRNFDIDLAAGKVFANRVNGAKAHVAILDLDLSGLQVGSSRGDTVLSGIKVNLDAQAAGALNATFKGLNLPAGLAFGTARVVVKG